MPSSRYPDAQMDFAPEIPERWRLFADLREDLLLDYGYNTARAYWADLQDIFEWAVDRDKDVLELSPTDLRQYVALLRRRKYSESTIRRRITALRKLYSVAAMQHSEANTAAQDLVIRRASDRRKSPDAPTSQVVGDDKNKPAIASQ